MINKSPSVTESLANKTESPYPGLRTFQEHESAYFFGRDNQIKEIVKRLRNNRFVAVIGGSGSGKSSLVLAGAIPELRTLAIQEAGDFWVPVITTPGTNHIGNNSPIRRLAEAFCAVLEESERNIENCVNLLRKENGLSVLIEKYGRKLQNSAGIDLTLTKLPTATNDTVEHSDLIENNRSEPDYLIKVNFLFLIDQFEELFHPSNTAVNDDCWHLVKRIIEHFKQSQDSSNRKKPSQICVALTMRSEHLNDCPRYLELPDAINAASFLVKRLDKDEIKEAIIKPAQAFLRRAFRKAEMDARKEGSILLDEYWPEEISFDDDVIIKLISDIDKIANQQDHADLLPLLQHLLYWIWDCALKRRIQSEPQDSIIPLTFPYEIKWEDLCLAVYPEVKEIDKNTNTLTQCLEQRCEWIYNLEENKPWHLIWENIFNNLAFKDPNTGTYTQRRASISELEELLSSAEINEKIPNIDTQNIQNNEKLKYILKDWLGPHQYLILNEDTLKVSHESLIRRWKRFRDWIDWKDLQFQAYVQILYACANWTEHGRNNDQLIGGAHLRQVSDYKLDALLNIKSIRQKVSHLLKDLNKKNESLKVQNLHNHFRDLLNLHRDKQKFNEKVMDSLGVFIIKSHRNKRAFLLKWSSLLLIGSILVTFFYYKNILSERNNELLLSLGITQETTIGAQKTDIPIDSQDQLQQSLLYYFFQAIDIRDKALEDRSESWLLKTIYPTLLKNRSTFSSILEYRIPYGLRSTLLRNAWRLEKNINQEDIKKADSFRCKAEIVEIINGQEKVVHTNSEARCYLRPDDVGKSEAYGLIAFPNEKVKLQVQVYWAKITREGGRSNRVTPKQKIWWSDEGNLLGVSAYLNYVIEYSDHLTQIVGINWPIEGEQREDQPLDNSHRILLYEKIKNSLENNNEPMISLPTHKMELAEDIELSNSFNNTSDTKEVKRYWYRFFDRTPSQSKEGPDSGLIKFDKNKYFQGDCKNPSNKSTMGTVMHASDGNKNYCLEMSTVGPDNEKQYTGVLYSQSLINYQEEFLPVLENLLFGYKEPEEIRIDTKNGWIYSKSKNDVWLIQPSSLEIWLQQANFIVSQNSTEFIQPTIILEYIGKKDQN